jgi:hypothetical protein
MANQTTSTGVNMKVSISSIASTVAGAALISAIGFAHGQSTVTPAPAKNPEGSVTEKQNLPPSTAYRADVRNQAGSQSDGRVAPPPARNPEGSVREEQNMPFSTASRLDVRDQIRAPYNSITPPATMNPEGSIREELILPPSTVSRQDVRKQL